MVPLRFSDGFETSARVLTFDGLVDGREHLAVGLGDRTSRLAPADRLEPPLVRLHSECLTGDVFGSQRCDCGPQLREAVERISEVGGFLLYLRQEGRGIGLLNKIRAYALQEQGLDTVEANLALGFRDDERDYAVAAHMLHSLGLRSLRLITNNPEKIRQLTQHRLLVSGRIPHVIPPNPFNRAYLETKARRSGHLIDLAGAPRLPEQSDRVLVEGMPDPAGGPPGE
jgi:GTP cyclohydrolase II